jgi:hypothetical protein
MKNWCIWQHTVVVCDDGDKTGGSDDGTAGGAAVGGDIRRVQLVGSCKHNVGVWDTETASGGGPCWARWKIRWRAIRKTVSRQHLSFVCIIRTCHVVFIAYFLRNCHKLSVLDVSCLKSNIFARFVRYINFSSLVTCERLCVHAWQWQTSLVSLFDHLS